MLESGAAAPLDVLLTLLSLEDDARLESAELGLELEVQVLKRVPLYQSLRSMNKMR